MKRYLLFLGIFIAAMSVQAQTLVFADGDTLSFDNDKLKKIIPNKNILIFISENDSTLEFNIKDIAYLDFAASYTDIESIGSDETAIVYDDAKETVSVLNGGNNSEIAVYNDKGILVKSIRGNNLEVGDLKPGLYVVSYNRKLNVKILKK